MTGTLRILWGEGIFLRPQHFQQQELFLEGRLAQCLAAIHAHPWGVRAARIDPAALAGGLLALEQVQVVFQDGTGFDAPGEDPLPPARPLADLAQLPADPLVYACLPLLDRSGGNAGVADRESGRPVRFQLDRAQVPDLHTEALESELAVLRTAVRLKVGDECRDGHFPIPIARLRRDAAGAWSADESYVPPVLAIRAAPPLLVLLKILLDALQAKSRALAGSHRERSRTVADYGSSDIASFWLLHTVNRSFPLLNHLRAFPQAHPEALYQGLAQLAGELLTFSSGPGLEAIPPYRHEALTDTFQQLGALVRGLLDTVISSRYAVIPLREVRPSFHLGALEGERLAAGCDLYLSVAGEGPATEILAAVPQKLKLGSPDDVDRILNSALPGVRLDHVTRTPPALPVRIGNHYFALDPQGPIYDRMLKAGSVCIYVPQALPALQLELLAVFR